MELLRKWDCNVPTLRFDFDGIWNKIHLYEITNKVSRKAPVNSTAPIRMISYGNGFILQSDKYSHDNAGESLKKYTLLKKGEMAYNHGASKNKKYGVCYSLKESDEARIPFVYHAFQINRGLPAFWNYALNISQIDKQLKKLVSSGARMDGLLNISYDDYMSISVYEPCVDEQAKISAFLSVIDKRIAVQNKIISKYETLIKGLKHQLYTKKIRFYSHSEISFPKWEKKQLGEILSISTEKNGSRYSKEKILSVSDEYGVVNQIRLQGKSFAGQDISNYKVVKSGQIIYTRSPLAAKPFGIIKIVGVETGIVSPLYIVNTVKKGNDALFIYYLFDSPESTNNYLKPLVRAGAKHTMNISNDEWLSGTVTVPCLEEQEMIAEFLESIDKKISFEKKILEKLREQKTYLLSEMFI